MTFLLALLLAVTAPTADQIEAQSIHARLLLKERNYTAAATEADQVYQLVAKELARRPLDQEPKLPLALGAAIEVKAQVLGAQGATGQAVSYLQAEMQKYRATSIRARIQKNINLLSLVGKPAPPLQMTGLLGPKPPAMKGKPVLLFFWAHWCSDCRNDAPVVASLQKQFPSLMIIGPTQHYGYVQGGEEASPAKESAYIETVRKQYFNTFAVPVSEENFKNYGASTTPTFVVRDKHGIVRLYHPGAMSLAELQQAIKPLL